MNDSHEGEPDPREEIQSLLIDEPRNHPFLWGLALLFLLFSVPFYYPSDRQPVLYGGLPDWCWITLISDCLFAVVVAILILFRWKEDPKPKEATDASSRGT